MEQSIDNVLDTLKGLIREPLKGERKFRVFLDDQEVFPGVAVIRTESDAWMVGTRPEGWQGLLYREIGGGGNVTIPWARGENGQVLVGMALENRPNLGKAPVWCAIGGFIDPGETRDQAQVREAAEESGLDTSGAKGLPGTGVVADRLYYVADVGKGEGVHIYEHELRMDQLEPAGENVWRPKPGMLHHKKESLTRFFPIGQAALMTGDSYMLAAILRLAVYLGQL